MTAMLVVWAVTVWLALQVPIGMATGWYIRRARTLAQVHQSLRHHERRQHYKRRAICARPAVLLRG